MYCTALLAALPKQAIISHLQALATERLPDSSPDGPCLPSDHTADLNEMACRCRALVLKGSFITLRMMSAQMFAYLRYDKPAARSASSKQGGECYRARPARACFDPLCTSQTKRVARYTYKRVLPQADTWRSLLCPRSCKPFTYRHPNSVYVRDKKSHLLPSCCSGTRASHMSQTCYRMGPELAGGTCDARLRQAISRPYGQIVLAAHAPVGNSQESAPASAHPHELHKQSTRSCGSTP